MFKKLLKSLPFLVIVSITAFLIIKINKESTPDADLSSFFSESKMIGKKVPEESLQILKSDQEISFQTYQGKYTILNVFASWCLPCKAEHPIFVDIAERIKQDEKIQLVGINWRDKESDAVKWLEKHGDPYNYVGFDNIGKYGIKLGIRGVPETYLIDPEGEVIKHKMGNINTQYSEEILNKIAELRQQNENE